MTNSYEMGALHRRDFRRLCMQLGLDFEEDKGWLDSLFIVTGSSESFYVLNSKVREWSMMSEDTSSRA